MKKIIAIMIMVVLTMSAMSTFAASTATSVYNEEKSTATDQYFTTSGKIENGGNGFVTLLVTTNGTVNVDNIMYIDQCVPNSDGTFKFENYIPKINVPEGQKYVVKVGATSLSQAISGGYLELPEKQGHTVTGTVGSKGTTNATLKIMKNGAAVGNATITNGTFSLSNIEDGTYEVVISKKAHLPAIAELTVNGGNVTMPKIELLAGDLVSTDGGVIGNNDLSKVIGLYGASASVAGTGYDVQFDLDDDGVIGNIELSAIIGNYGKTADPRCYE